MLRGWRRLLQDTRRTRERATHGERMTITTKRPDGLRQRGRPRLDAQMIPQILDGAERLFAQRGTANVSIRDIAAEAGLPHSAIYRYFESKDDVLRQVLLRGRQRQIERDERSRETERPLEGALEWLMTENRAYVLALARAALEGETSTSLGLDRQTSGAAPCGRWTRPIPLRGEDGPRSAHGRRGTHGDERRLGGRGGLDRRLAEHRLLRHRVRQAAAQRAHGQHDGARRRAAEGLP